MDLKSLPTFLLLVTLVVLARTLIIPCTESASSMILLPMPDSNKVDGNINITNDTQWVDLNVTVSQSIIVSSNASLHLKYSTLLFDSHIEGLKLEIHAQGTLLVENSTIRPLHLGEDHYYINALWESHFTVVGSVISGAGWGTEDTIWDDHTGVLVHSTDPLVVNSSFLDNFVSLQLKDTENSVVVNNLFVRSKYYAIWINAAHNTTILDNSIIESDKGAIIAESFPCRQALIANNTIEDTGEVAMTFIRVKSFHFSNNTLTNAGVSGVELSDSFNVSFVSNTIDGIGSSAVGLYRVHHSSFLVNTITRSDKAFRVANSINNIFGGNTLSDNHVSLELGNENSRKNYNVTQGNLFYQNTFNDSNSVFFADNQNPPSYSSFEQNYFDTGLWGNYWSENECVDDDHDQFCDSAYCFDNHPFSSPVSPDSLVTVPRATVSKLSEDGFSPGDLLITGPTNITLDLFPGDKSISSVEFFLDGVSTTKVITSAQEMTATFELPETIPDGLHKSFFRVCDDFHCTPVAFPFQSDNGHSIDVVDSKVVLSDTEKTYYNDLVVSNNGLLVVERSTLSFESATPLEHSILVQEGGVLVLNQSTLRPLDKTKPFNLIVEPGGRLILEDSLVEHLASADHTTLGLTINSDSNIIQNTTLMGTELLVGGSNNYIRNNTFLGVSDLSVYDSQFVLGTDDSELIFVENNVFDGLGQGGTGVYVTRSTNAPSHYFVENNIFQHLHTGINVAGGSLRNASICYNTLLSNEIGIKLSAGQGNLLVGNTFVENTIHAKDDSLALNYWSLGGLGNYWGGYSSAGEIMITGTTGAVDISPSPEPFTKDTVAPSIEVITPVGGSTLNPEVVNFNFSIKDESQYTWLQPSGLHMVQYAVNGSLLSSTSLDTIEINFMGYADSFVEVRIEAWDNQGNKASEVLTYQIGFKKPILNPNNLLTPVLGLVLLVLTTAVLVLYWWWRKTPMRPDPHLPDQVEIKVALLKFLQHRLSIITKSQQLALLSQNDLGENNERALSTSEPFKHVFINKINPLDVLVLVEIAESYPKPCFPSSLSEKLMKPKNIISRSLKRLNELSFIHKRLSRKELVDSRYRGYSLSEEGVQFLFWLKDQIDKVFENDIYEGGVEDDDGDKGENEFEDVEAEEE